MAVFCLAARTAVLLCAASAPGFTVFALTPRQRDRVEDEERADMLRCCIHLHCCCYTRGGSIRAR